MNIREVSKKLNESDILRKDFCERLEEVLKKTLTIPYPELTVTLLQGRIIQFKIPVLTIDDIENIELFINFKIRKIEPWSDDLLIVTMS